jgi:outer membrane usher protein FimD/PapC
MRLVLEDGLAVPSGAVVVMRGRSFPVALDGFTYVNGLAEPVTARAHWPNAQCEFELDAVSSGGEVAALGDVVCRKPRP